MLSANSINIKLELKLIPGCRRLSKRGKIEAESKVSENDDTFIHLKIGIDLTLCDLFAYTVFKEGLAYKVMKPH